MRRLRNTVYITQEDYFLNREGETIVIQKDREKVLQVPIHNIEGIVFLTPATVTPQVLELCSSSKVHVSFISHNAEFLVRIQNPVSGNIALRKDQFKLAADSIESLRLAKYFCAGKIFNSRIVLLRLVRDHGDDINKESVNKVIAELGKSARRVLYCVTMSELLGVEGDAAKLYFSVFNELILRKEEGFIFQGRSRRPPLDEVNALLSFFYVMLVHEVESALETVGLDAQMGFYHQSRSGRSSLALDMMEELRAYMVDRFVISIINNKQVCKSDFHVKENGAVLIRDEARSKILQQWQKRKNDIIEHPFLKEKIEVGLIPYAQALLLARFMRGDIDDYPPFLMR